MLGPQNEVPVQQGISPGARQLARQGSNYTLYRYKKEAWPSTSPDPEPRLPVFALLGAGAEPEPYAPYIEGDLTSTAAGPDGAAAVLPPTLDELVETLSASPQLLLYIHGFNNGSATVAEKTHQYPPRFLADTRNSGEAPGIGVWLTYDWPGESAGKGKAFSHSFRTALELAGYLAVWLALLVIPLLLVGLAARHLSGATISLLQPLGCVLLFIVWPLLFTVWLLRFTSYERDLYMALHRGVPDLCEFLRHLDYAYYERNKAAYQDPSAMGESLGKEKRIQLHVIAHSMGTMVTLNTVRILSDLFEGAPGAEPSAKLGRSLEVGTLVLVGADAPVELLQEGQNNYFYSALRRFDHMYVFSNAHDAVLHTLSYFANSFAEPQPGRSRSRLGNVFHPDASARPPSTTALCTRRWFWNEPVFEFKTGDPFPDPVLIQKRLSFIECSDLRPLSTWLTRRLAGLAPIRDFLALICYPWVDCHAGYFDDDQVWRKIHSAIRGTLSAGQAGNEVLRSQSGQ